MPPKVIISTDIGGNDKDDAQSFIHALLYADEVDYRGFVATSSDASGVNGIAPMNKIIDAYAQDLPNLREGGDYPSAAELRDLIAQGATEGDWPGPLSDGARLIIEEARKASPDDPLYLLGWGPIHDIARALFEVPEIVENVRVYSVAGYLQDSKNPAAFNWLKNAVANNADYRDLFWIDAQETFRGMYVTSSGSNNPNANLDWVKDNVDGHGALGDLFYSDYTYNLYGGSSPDGLKMGDTPSLLYLLDSANNDNPGASSWGGSFRKASIGTNHWVDQSGNSLGQYDGARTVYQHREAAWGDFAAKLDLARNGVPGSSTPVEDPATPPEPDADDQGPTQEPVLDTPTVEPDPVASPTSPSDQSDGGSDDIIKGGSASDALYGGAGDDELIGRGGQDTLQGGADNDLLRAGAGNDRLIYDAAINSGDTDLYIGSSGFDTLELRVSEDMAASRSFQAEVAALEHFIDREADVSSHGGATFHFDSIGLSVRAIERVEIVVTTGSTSTPSTPAGEPADEAPATPPPASETPVTDAEPGTMPEFETIGNSWGEEMRGGSYVDSFYGANGNDVLLGRGGDDILSGGSGSDFVKGGAGRDYLVYIADKNANAADQYQGSRGVDTLALFVDEELYASAAFQDDVAGFEAFAKANYDTSKDGGDAYQFSSFNLRVQSTENLEVYLYDLG